MENNIDRIIKQCQTWAVENLGKDFVFRKYQLEATVAVVNNVINNTKAQAINAPTGSGKSLIGFISAGVLWKYYGKQSYILVSDLSLFKQCEDEIKQYNLGWGCLKGKDNYICRLNGNTMNSSECAINKVSFNNLVNPNKASYHGYPCAVDCEYVQARNLALKSPVTVLTYQLYLIHRNSIYLKFEGKAKAGSTPEIFPERDLVICDEAHKIPDIIQSHFSPQIPFEVPSYIKTLNKWIEDDGRTLPDYKFFESLVENIKEEESNIHIVRMLDKYRKLEVEYLDIISELEKDSKTDSIKYMNATNALKMSNRKLSDFLDLVNVLGEAIAVKTVNEKSITINCTYEGKMINKNFHAVSKSEMFMSATLGNFDTYKEILGLGHLDGDNWKVYELPNTFDFSKSPIYYSTKNPMTFKEKDKSFPEVLKQIETITNNYNDKRGIIQTGSHEFTKKLIESSSPELRKRMIFYSVSKEKDSAVKRFLSSENGILVGASLLEGLSFDGDKCRFSIVMKLPYASLANNLISVKNKLNPKWYGYDCISKLEQGIGRGVRFDGDWCVNIILDGSFANLLRFNRNLFNKDILKRLVKIP